MIRALILVGPNFQDEEFVYPYYRMLEEGWKVDVATVDGDNVSGKYGVPARATLPFCACTKVRSGADPLYDVVFVPGGFESPDRIRTDEYVKQIISIHYAHGKLVAAICHGPWVLISAGVFQDSKPGNLVKATCYQSIKDDLVNAGAFHLDSSVVVDEDHNLITAQHYRDNGPFMKAVVEWIKNKK